MESQRDFTLDTAQLQELGQQLALLPGELLQAIRATLSTSVHTTLRGTVSKFYSISATTLAKTYAVRALHKNTSSESVVEFEVGGRLLTLAHFTFFPRKNHVGNPTIEVLKGMPRTSTRQVGQNGKAYTPFVMRTGAKKMNKVTLNVFVLTGRKQKGDRSRWELYSYRTLSVPQMLGNPNVADEVTTELLTVFDQKLLKKVESYTGVIQKRVSEA